MKQNYQIVLDKTIDKLQKEEKVPTLLLHSCCGPCSTYVLEYLSKYFKITVYYYNPNIYPSEEFYFRENEQRELLDKIPFKYPVQFMAARYDTGEYYDAIKGYEKDREGGERCEKCFFLRFREVAKVAKENGFDYFTTTLSISPHKDSQLLNKIGKTVSDEFGVEYLYSDFKKRGGFKRSVELTRELSMYRQDYCGCIFSKNEKEKLESEKEKL